MARPLIKGDADAPGGGGVWGSPALDPAAASAPTSPAAAAITQETQVANEAARVAQAAAQLPPPPFGQPIIGADGRVSQAWIPWLTKLYQRSGGAAVTSASDLDILTEFDDLPEAPRSAAEALDWADPAPRPAPEVLDWLQSLTPQAQVAMLAQQVEVLTCLVLGAQERGWNRQAGLTAPAAAAPAGGVGTAAGGWDTAANRDAAIATVNNLRTRLLEVETVLKSARIL